MTGNHSVFPQSLPFNPRLFCCLIIPLVTRSLPSYLCLIVLSCVLICSSVFFLSTQTHVLSLPTIRLLDRPSQIIYPERRPFTSQPRSFQHNLNTQTVEKLKKEMGEGEARSREELDLKRNPFFLLRGLNV